uniref:Uncharacterized protein n=1 Tax=Moniliophthora roreri TaxID=221103 RepID=A0A0W0FDF1_MONRR
MSGLLKQQTGKCIDLVYKSCVEV